MSDEGQPRLRAYSQPNPVIQLPFCDPTRRVTMSVVCAWESSQGEDSIMLEQPENPQNETGNPQPYNQDPPTNPKEITPAIWLQMFNRLNSTLDNLSTEIKELKDFKTKVEPFTQEWNSTVDTDMINTDSRMNNQQFKINLLMNMIINQEERLALAEKHITAAYQGEIRPNLIVHGILEVTDETRSKLLEKVQTFFKEDYGN